MKAVLTAAPPSAPDRRIRHPGGISQPRGPRLTVIATTLMISHPCRLAQGDVRVPALYLDFLNALDVEALALTDEEILAAVEEGLAAQGRDKARVLRIGVR
jgi:hypothetical protein